MSIGLEAHKGWLCQRRLISAHQVRLFAGWVERFLHLQSTRPIEVGRTHCGCSWRIWGKIGLRAGSCGRQPIYGSFTHCRAYSAVLAARSCTDMSG